MNDINEKVLIKFNLELAYDLETITSYTIKVKFYFVYIENS